MASFLSKFRSKFRRSATAETEALAAKEISDIALEDAVPTEIKAKARHAGMIYNYSRNTRYGTETYTPQEYDLSVVANAIDTDGFFRRAIEKYIELIWKNGFTFIGRNQATVNYIRSRFDQIAQATVMPTEQLMRDISYQLVGYANTYISKVRSDDASGGRIRTTFTGQELTPVAGYFVEDSISIQLAFKPNGEPIGYK